MSTPREHFINKDCFGDDVARWLMEQLRSKGLETGPEPGQEDFGWYLTFRADEADHDFIVGFRPDDDNGQAGCWLGTLERKRGLVGSMLGLRKRGVSSTAVDTLHAILSTSPLITGILWFTDEDFADAVNGQATPSTSETSD